MIDFTNCEINKFRYYGGKNGGNRILPRPPSYGKHLHEPF